MQADDVMSAVGAAVPELPNFTKVCSLTLPEVGLPPRMFTAGIYRKCKLNFHQNHRKIMFPNPNQHYFVVCVTF